jgi:hypothetical protein
MAKPLPGGALAVTANDLATGAVVFLRHDGRWTDELLGAEIAATPSAAETLLARAKADQESCRVVEPVLIEVTIEGNRPVPVRLRERIRAGGPTVPYGRD